MTAVAEPAVQTPKPPEHNLLGLDYRRPWPRPKVKGWVIDSHTHLFARRHADDWQAVNHHFGIDAFVSMTPLEEAVVVQRQLGERVKFIAIPDWFNHPADWADDWLRRLEAFYNLGSRVVKFHMAPGTMDRKQYSFEHPGIRKVIAEARSRNMILMSHLGDPDTWYHTKYTDHAKFGTRDRHYAQWEAQLQENRGHTWWGAHLGGNPEDVGRLIYLMDTYPDLVLDLSATRWMVREVSNHRDAIREFVIKYADRLMWGSDQVSGDARGFDFLASRMWAHRKLWETAYVGDSPIADPDLPEGQRVTLRGLALPDETLQKVYHDTVVRVLAKHGVTFDEPA